MKDRLVGWVDRCAGRPLSLIVHLGAVTLAIVAFAVTILAHDDPTTDPGVSAAIIALCVAMLAIAEAMNAEVVLIPSSWVHRIRRIVIGVGATGSAYLWIADETKSSASEVNLLFGLLILFGAAAGVALIVFSIVWSLKSDWDRNRNQ